MSSSPTVHKWILVCSNLAYLVPGSVVIYQLLKRTGRRMNIFIGVELLLVFAFITFFTSSSYHMCRADLSIQENVDPQEKKISGDHKLNPCLTCPPNTMSWVGHLPFSKTMVKYNISKTFDHLFANFAIFLVMINVIPLKQNFKQLVIIASLIWFCLLLEGGNCCLASFPIICAMALFIIFWIIARKNISGSRNIAWILAVVFTILALVCYTLEPYWIMHSLWHVLGAFAGALLLSQTAGCYQNMKGAVALPQFMKAIFKPADTCKMFDFRVPSRK
jgi:hypothetical protein